MTQKTNLLGGAGRNSLGRIRRYSDIGLALGVVGILLLLFMRVTPAAMDGLLAINLAVSLTVLMMALFVPAVSRMPSFPTVLLLCTLFRLALNISSTRLILLEANAGHIITAFGQFVVGGNYVVGGVVFILLSIIQLIVISKGAERAGEVTARFVSDSVAGKQAAIDADLARGDIKAPEAKRRRLDLERETKLHGALTGAMYFVKGDTIAGIIISLVNIIGGLIVGVAQNGMPIAQAAETYSLLTIGDGLVTQISALVTTVSAGLIMTRVSAGDEERLVADDIVDQILANPRALLTVAAVLAVIGFSQPVTGFPLIPFMLLAILVAAVAFSQRRLRAKLAGAGEQLELTASVDRNDTAFSADPALPAPPITWSEARSQIALDSPRPIAVSMHPELLNPSQKQTLAAQLESARVEILSRFGIELPDIVIAEDSSLDRGRYTIHVNRIPVASAGLNPEESAVVIPSKEQFDTLTAASITFSQAALPGSLRIGAGLTAPNAAKAAAMNIRPLNRVDLIYQHVYLTLIRNLAEFVDIQAISRRVDRLNDSSPDLVQCVITKGTVTLPQITDVVRRLVRERVPVRDLQLILESLVRRQSQPMNITQFMETVRGDLRGQICAASAIRGMHIDYHSLDEEIAAQFRSNRDVTPDGTVCSLGGAARKAINTAFSQSLDLMRAYTGNPVVVLVDPDIRWLVRDFLSSTFPDVTVLSKTELVNIYEVKPAAPIAFRS